MDLHNLTHLTTSLPAQLNSLTTYFHAIPGSAIALRYIKSSYQNDPVRSVVELLLLVFAVRYLLRARYSAGRKRGGFVEFGEEEIDELVDDWVPEPLVTSTTALEDSELEKRPVLVGPTGPKSRLSNGRTVTNLASYNFHNFIASDTIKDRAIATLRAYGVGPCGPPGFYGTQDVHMKTEADVAAHIGVDACIVYAQSFSTVSSVIPAFSKRGDIIVADKCVSFAIRKGIQISRSTVRWFEHNDMEDLERVLVKVIKEQGRKPLTRRFIVSEGLFENVGDAPDLPKLVELKQRYKFRLLLDETTSYGNLGRTAAGLTEHQNVDPTLIDILIGSLAGPLCAGGGFCAGGQDIVEHQRISSAAYTFSAALPAMLATTASVAIGMLGGSQEGLVNLRENIKALRAQLEGRSEWVRGTSEEGNAVQIFVVKEEVCRARGLGVGELEGLVGEFLDECLAQNLLITRVRPLPMPLGSTPKDVASAWQPTPALKVCVTAGLTKKEMERAGVIIRHAVTKCMTRRR